MSKISRCLTCKSVLPEGLDGYCNEVCRLKARAHDARAWTGRGSPTAAAWRAPTLDGCGRGDSDAGDGDFDAEISRMALAYHGLRGRDRGGISRRLSHHRRGGGRRDGAVGEHERGRTFGLDATGMAGALRTPMD